LDSKNILQGKKPSTFLLSSLFYLSMNAFKQELLRLGFPREKIERVRGAYDLVGDIAVLEAEPSLRKYFPLLAQAIRNINKHVKVVARKAGATKGRFRVRKISVISGEKRSFTVHKESGCAFKVDLNKAFFSPRLAFERERVAAQVKPGENVLVAFAGVGPFAVVAAKKQPNASVVAVELNPQAVKLLKENIELNKVGDRVQAVKADAAKFFANEKNWERFDRVVMPLPHGGYGFLPAGVKCCRKGGTIHFYYIPPKGKNAEKEAVRLARQACAENKRKFKLLFTRPVLTFAPHVDEVVVDFKAL
jgi:tRNA (guanine37-N1)-methyltransferase